MRKSILTQVIAYIRNRHMYTYEERKAIRAHIRGLIDVNSDGRSIGLDDD